LTLPAGIRSARPEEFALLSAIEDEAGRRFDEAGMHLAAGVNVADRGELPLAAFVAGEPPVGFVWVLLACGHPHVEEIAVVPEAGRRGIGRALLEAACWWAQGAGYDRVTLCTYRDVPWNGPFYRSAGFVELAEADWCEELAEIRAAERAAGLDDFGVRVVMVRPLVGPRTSGNRK
jgi:GNAT superfamily N-acetyltransferase